MTAVFGVNAYPLFLDNSPHNWGFPPTGGTVIVQWLQGDYIGSDGPLC
jgi:hypothetical protein